MKSFLVSLIVFAVLACNCAAQHKTVISKDSATLCWVNDCSSCKYIVYSSEYVPGAIPAWNFVGETTNQYITVRRGIYKKEIYEIMAIHDGDTSDAHSTLDETACSDMADCGIPCITTGSWYVDWKLKKAFHIRIAEVKN